jgi:uncharacterized YigZ family protein
MFEETYKMIAAPTEALFKDKGSRFISLAYPVKSEESAQAIIAEIKKKYYDATHHCYAYSIGHIGSPCMRLNDDGEPSGTAARPIYGQILSHDLKNILVIVVRYFGGIKLGVSGLINAYKEATRAVLDTAKIEEHQIKEVHTVQFDYGLMNTVMLVLKNSAVSIKSNDYQDDMCKITFEAGLVKSREICLQLEKIYGVKLDYVRTI